jgi:hypothetical protein
MPWARLDDGFYDHEKVEGLPNALRLKCVGLFTLALSYSNRHLTDGRVSGDRLRRFGGTPQLVEALITANLFERAIDGIVIHDFAIYNKTRAQVERGQADMRDLGKRGGVRSGEARRFNRVPVPARPGPSQEPPSPHGVGASGSRAHGTNPRAVAKKAEAARLETAKRRREALQAIRLRGWNGELTEAGVEAAIAELSVESGDYREPDR